MKVTEIIVSAGRTFNHPYESYSNMKPQVTVKATVDEGEDLFAVTKDLQAKAESLVEDHKTHLLNSLRELENMRVRDQKITQLERLIKTSQGELEDMRKGLPAAPDGDAEDDRFETDDSDREEP